MNDPENTTKWKVGDIVIHDADAKNSKMLMVVTGFLMNDRVVTKYISKDLKTKYKKNNRWFNPNKVLHDPHNYEECLVFCGCGDELKSEKDLSTKTCWICRSVGTNETKPEKDFIRYKGFYKILS